MDLSNQKRIIFLGIAVAIIFAFCFLAIKIEKRIERQNIRAAEVKVTIPEGFNISNIENTLAFKLPNFKKDKFLLEAEKKEGYLFPDTYFFLLADDGSKAIQTMSDNFVKKISIVLPEINLSGKTENEIITMAAIIEKEAKGSSDRGIISGILWKRISKGMLLQVDAAPETYKQKGLPMSPICNPGLEAINAAIYPENSPYLFYLHDKNGMIHYAGTFAEHQKNVAKYLNK